ncbi:pyridoxamine 5'-phosphate oxidase family protein [Haloarculaceae archaeon H-GB2-1]|nr:pyridoxamine 5'-phosphate oxidase family protein [Haloarculaceae archaeon H-GB11]MEA5408821.1 pyridoxamine 5'-phosphate oxidase family protein [Haloarculaceae archaeon H-GB2-1]
MALDQQTEMTQSEIDDVLSRHETGVLSLARSDDPYAIPISYGYDSEHRRFYMRLVSTPESEKREFLSSSPDCRLVVYEETEPVYQSVVAIGTLEQISTDELTADHIEQYGKAKRPLFEIWAEGKEELDVQLFKLDPESMSGRRIEIES